MERLLLRTLGKLKKRNINFSIKDLINESGTNPDIAHQSNFYWLGIFGYKHLQARKKGLLNENDRKVGTYARKTRKLLQTSPDFYTNHIAFYLNGVSFVHKYNPLNVAMQPKSRV